MGPLFWPWTRVNVFHSRLLKKLKKNKKVAFPSLYLLFVVDFLTLTQKNTNQNAKWTSSYNASSSCGSTCSCRAIWSSSSSNPRRAQSTASTKWRFIPHGFVVRRRLGQGCHRS